MKKKILIILVVFIIIIGAYALYHYNDNDIGIEQTENQNTETSNTEISQKDIEELINTLYSNVPEGTLPGFQTMKIELTDSEAVKYDTGITSIDKIEEAYKSEPMMSSQAYSLVIVKVKNSEDVNAIQKEMVDGVNPRKWICVCADKIYSATSGNIVALVMSNEAWATPVYEAIKKEFGNSMANPVEKTVEESTELPADM